MEPGTRVRLKSHQQQEGVVMSGHPFGKYRYVIEYPDGTREECVEVKFVNEPGGGILSVNELEVLEA